MLEEVRFEVDKEVPAQTDIHLDDVGILIGISWEFDVNDHEENYGAGLCSVIYSKHLYFSHNMF